MLLRHFTDPPIGFYSHTSSLTKLNRIPIVCILNIAHYITQIKYVLLPVLHILSNTQPVSKHLNQKPAPNLACNFLLYTFSNTH